MTANPAIVTCWSPLWALSVSVSNRETGGQASPRGFYWFLVRWMRARLVCGRTTFFRPAGMESTGGGIRPREPALRELEGADRVDCLSQPEATRRIDFQSPLAGMPDDLASHGVVTPAHRDGAGSAPLCGHFW